MVLLAFSAQDQVEKYGAYVGMAAFFVLAILPLLYFAQAREVKRLREWAGRAPERAAELQDRVTADASRRVGAQPPPAVPRPPPPPPVPAPAPPPRRRRGGPRHGGRARRAGGAGRHPGDAGDRRGDRD